MTTWEAKIRLKEAVDAMRSVRKVTAKQWEEAFPSFALASTSSTFAKASRDPWERRVDAMNTELNLRIAEVLCAEVK